MPPVREPAEIRALLETDRPWAVYALGDLAPALFARCAWWRGTGPAPALALLYQGFTPHVIFLLGAAEQYPALLEEIGTRPALYLHVRPEALPALRERYDIPAERRMWRMVIDPRRFRPSPTDEAVRLGPGNVAALQELYHDGDATGEAPDFFAPDMLTEGVYFGIREGTALTAAAGTHLVAPAEGVGAVGNVYTRRDCRGQGLGACATAAVTAELLRQGLRTVALNVAQQNAALRVYERLGFARYCEFVEGPATAL
jgi:ribosomal protein S18 acetylase RimI-like enzyme